MWSFSLEVFRHTGRIGHLLFTAELPICSRNAETPKTSPNCHFSGRFWAFAFDMSGFILVEVSFTARHSKTTVCRFRVTKKRRIATTLLSCSEDGARERYSIICCTFSFCLQPLCRWLHRRWWTTGQSTVQGCLYRRSADSYRMFPVWYWQAFSQEQQSHLR